MITKMFSIYDVKADTFGTPFFFPADGLARRAFADLVGDVNTVVGRHPDDFQLFCIGTFDDVPGTVVACEPLSLGFGVDFVVKDAVPLKRGA